MKIKPNEAAKVDAQQIADIAEHLNKELHNTKLKKKPAFDEKEPIFADFFYQNTETMRDYPNRIQNGDDRPPLTFEPHPLGYTMVPHSGGRHGSPEYKEDAWYGWYAIDYAQAMADAGEQIALMIRPYNCPFPYGDEANERGSPDAFRMALEQLPKLDYVLMDIEGDREMIELNTREIHRMVREHPDPKFNRARIGNYGYSAAEYDESIIWPNRRNLRTRHPNHDQTQLYLDCLDISMPNAYPYATASQHLSTYTQGDNVAPNGRAAIFWQALERHSTAARALPENHMLMPWVGEYIYHTSPNYNAPKPSDEDNVALMFHFRMRNARCFYAFAQSFQREYIELAMKAWKALDPIFRLPVEKKFMNLETSKRTGFNWSGVEFNGHRIMLFSNLSDKEVSIGKYKIMPGEHKFLTDDKMVDIPEI